MENDHNPFFVMKCRHILHGVTARDVIELDNTTLLELCPTCVAVVENFVIHKLIDQHYTEPMAKAIRLKDRI